MKVVFFDLGRTLEENDVLFPGAQQTLQKIQLMRDKEAQPFVLGLISDWIMPDGPEDIPGLQERYYAIIDRLGIRAFFEPVAERVTLSTEAGVFKPDQKIFRLALDKIDPELQFDDAIFITEKGTHVAGARDLGMGAIHFKSPGEAEGEVDQLVDIPRLIEEHFQIPTARAIQRELRTTSLAVARKLSDAPRARPDPTGGVASNWARFGDDVLLFGNEDGWGDLAERAGRAAAEISERHVTARRDHLHLVIQKGRLFQREYPDVPVLYDHGRFLVVDLDPAKVQEIECRSETCFEIRTLNENDVVFDVPRPSAQRRAPEPAVQQMVDKVSKDVFLADVTHLASFPTRLSSSSDFVEAADWVRGRLAMGYVTRLQSVSVPGGTSLNVIAERAGEGDGPRDVIVVVAHLDSVNHDDNAGPAPGADDNASGSAGVLQVADALKDHPSVHDLCFILTGGEEQNLLGTKHYIQTLTGAERGKIKAVVNMDMISIKNTEQPTVLLEGRTLSQHLIRQLQQAAETYVPELQVQTRLFAFGSDHVPFLNAGIPAVLTIEGADSESEDIIHSSRDMVANVNVELAINIIKMNAAFVAMSIQPFADS